MVFSPLFSLLPSPRPPLPGSWSIESSALPADQSSSQSASQTSCGIIACQSCLHACFSSCRHAPDKKHIFTHKNEITGNLSAGALEATPAIEPSKSMNSSLSLGAASSRNKRKRKHKRRKTKRRNSRGMQAWPPDHLPFMSFFQDYTSCSAPLFFAPLTVTLLLLSKLLVFISLRGSGASQQ